MPAGDRAAFARELWPEERYPFLYQEVPEDIRRPLWEDGKLVGGQDIPWMADRHFSAGLTKAAAQSGLAAALIALLAQPLLLLAWKGFASQSATAEPVLLEQFPGEAPAYVSGWDVWQTVAADFTATLFGGAITILGLLAAWLLIAVGVGILVAIAAIEHWRREASAPYEVLSKDAHVRWPFRAEAREIARAGYVRQVAHATDYLADAPLFHLGKGTGTLRVRGDMAAPSKGQTLALDGESLFQHLLVFGGTGDGKTTAILKPLLRQVFAEPECGAYITDAKGVLWHDAEKIAAAAGRSGDVLRIGTGTGDLGVNITASLAPSHVAAVLRSVLAQVGGAQGDTFWPDMAANLMRHALTVGRAYAATPEGEAEASRVHPSSLWWAYQTVLDEKRLQSACDAIARANKACLEAMEDARKASDQEALLRQIDRMGVLSASDVAASLSYVTTTWKDMAKDTKTGITANISQLMDGFAGATALRERFLCGQDSNPKSTASHGAALRSRLPIVPFNGASSPILKSAASSRHVPRCLSPKRATSRISTLVEQLKPTAAMLSRRSQHGWTRMRQSLHGAPMLPRAAKANCSDEGKPRQQRGFPIPPQAPEPRPRIAAKPQRVCDDEIARRRCCRHQATNESESIPQIFLHNTYTGKN
ncbi:MAG: hypothetical protein AB7E05_05915 [Sphingobium sp.]